MLAYIPRTPVQYAFTIIFIMLLGILHEAIVGWHSVLESRWLAKNKLSACYPYRLDDKARRNHRRTAVEQASQPETSR